MLRPPPQLQSVDTFAKSARKTIRTRSERAVWSRNESSSFWMNEHLEIFLLVRFSSVYGMRMLYNIILCGAFPKKSPSRFQARLNLHYNEFSLTLGCIIIRLCCLRVTRGNIFRHSRVVEFLGKILVSWGLLF